MTIFEHEQLLKDFKKKQNSERGLSKEVIKLYTEFFKKVRNEDISKQCFLSFKDFFEYEDYINLSEYTIEVYRKFLDCNKKITEDNLREFRLSILKEDKEYKNFFTNLISLDRSERTIESYGVVVKQYTQVINLLPIEYINEAKKEQLKSIEEEISPSGEIKRYIVEPDVENSNLRDYLLQFKEYFTSKKMKDVTIHNKLSTMRTFYKERGVKSLPKTITKTIPKNDIPLTKEIINIAIETAKKKIRCISIMGSSGGFRSYDMRYFIVDDFLKSIGVKTIEEFFQLENYDIIGYWSFIPNKTKRLGIVCQTCTSKQFTKEYKSYLEERIANGEKVTPESPLFVNENNEIIERTYFSKMITYRNRYVYNEVENKLKNQLELELISKEEYDEKIKNIPYFHNHGLRSFFITQITKGGNPAINLTMEGHRSNIPTHKNYVKFTKEEIMEYYETIEKYVSLDTKMLTEDEREQIKEEVKEEVTDEFKDELSSKDKRIEELEALIGDLGSRIDKIEKPKQYNEQLELDLLDYKLQNNINDQFFETKLREFCKQQIQKGKYDKGRIPQWAKQLETIIKLDPNQKKVFEQSIQKQDNLTNEIIQNKTKNLKLLNKVLTDIDIEKDMYDKIDYYISMSSDKILTEQEIKDITIKVLSNDIDDDIDI